MANDTEFIGAIPELYDRCLGPMLFEPFAQDLAARFAGFDGDLLETAAGTGRVTRALAAAAPASRIIATDLNGPMLAQAAALGSPATVAWRPADAQALPFGDASFDAVVCQFGVMFYPDKAAGYGEALRVLRGGGRYVFSVWDRLADNDISLVTHETLAGLFPGDPPGFLPRTPFGYNDKDEIAAALARAGFLGVTIDTVRLPTPSPSVGAAAEGLCLGSPLRADIEARDPGGLERAVAAVAGALADRFGDGPITGQGQALVVTATA